MQTGTSHVDPFSRCQPDPPHWRARPSLTYTPSSLRTFSVNVYTPYLSRPTWSRDISCVDEHQFHRRTPTSSTLTASSMHYHIIAAKSFDCAKSHTSVPAHFCEGGTLLSLHVVVHQPIYSAILRMLVENMRLQWKVSFSKHSTVVICAHFYHRPHVLYSENN